MRLTRVEIKGFKSIAKKTVLSFPGAITCIAGPNGCGKSNVVDAIRWALGEQSARAMRAGSMGDVIFAGTQDVPGSSLASVTLDFARVGGSFPKELDGFDEFSIARRLFRSGESIYTINDVRCRLKDITDLFLDTGLDRQGYAIIEQGRVKDIILAKPEDIRHILEEVAEVGKFRVKRTEAIKRLEATQGNLERIKDLLQEVGRQRDALKAQAGKAKRYQVLRDKINTLTRLVWGEELEGIKRRKEGLDDEVRVIDQGIQGVDEGLVEQNTRLGEINTRLEALKEDMDRVGAELQDARSRHAVARSEQEACEVRLADMRATIARSMQHRQTAEEENRTALSEIETGARELEALRQRLETVKQDYDRHKEEVDACQARFGAVSAGYDAKRAELFDALGQVRAVEQRIGFLRQRRDEVKANIAKRTQELSAMSTEEEALRAELEVLSARGQEHAEYIGVRQQGVLQLKAEQALLLSGLERDSQHLIALEKRHTELSTKIAMLGRIVKGAHAGAQTNPAANGFKRVSDAISVRTGFEEAAGSFGDLLDYLIIRDHDEVVGPHGVRAQGPGFIPADPHVQDPGDESPPQGEGLEGPLKTYVEAGAGFEAVLEVLTRGKWVVRDLPSAVSLWRAGQRSHTLVTRDGMTLEASGILRTNPEKDKYAEILKAKAELAALSAQERDLTIDLERQRTCLQENKGRLAEVNRTLESLLAEQQKAERELEAVKTKSQGLQSRLDRMAERRETYRRDILAWETMSGGMEQEARQIEEERLKHAARVEALQSGLKELESQKGRARQELDTAQTTLQKASVTVGELKVAHASRAERLKGLSDLLDRRNQEIEGDRARIEELGGKAAEVGALLEKHRQDVARIQEEITALTARHDAFLPEFQRLTEAGGDLRRRVEELHGARTALERQRQELLLGDKEQAIALKMLMERYQARFGDELPEPPEGFDPTAAREEIALAQTKIDAMGQINFAAIESYEEAQARFDDLHRQYEDLVLGGTRLKELILGIERESTKEFMATFVKVRAHFQELFTLMFGGGQADIVLKEGEGMDAGVEIFACPPFKRLKAMSLLSEGEKTLTAISFIFALFKVKPSPFCILDEVDAPLDDANVERLNRLIKSFARDAQFLVVTHNKNTMEIADVIYGVTFDVPGVTKVVSMDLQGANGT